ncbi:MAG: sugar transferase, partial [Campylobacter sp.]|nr:sugar transferase [Campylobacter sp.]
MKYLKKRVRAIFLPQNQRIKSLIDKLLVLLTSPTWLPAMLIISVILKLKEPNEPVFFTQNRLGQHG